MRPDIIGNKTQNQVVPKYRWRQICCHLASFFFSGANSLFSLYFFALRNFARASVTQLCFGRQLHCWWTEVPDVYRRPISQKVSVSRNLSQKVIPSDIIKPEGHKNFYFWSYYHQEICPKGKTIYFRNSKSHTIGKWSLCLIFNHAQVPTGHHWAVWHFTKYAIVRVFLQFWIQLNDSEGKVIQGLVNNSMFRKKIWKN